MCGIGGFSGDFEPGLLERMNRIQAHRGPDQEGTWHDPARGVGLAHRRLSIIDLSEAGRQPMADPSGQVVIAFNGEIYNYRALRAELEAEGQTFRGHSDTEVLLHLYRRDGPAMLERLNGIYAFAIWDARDNPGGSGGVGGGSLFLARDGLGIKPLYYAETARGFLFGSEMKILLGEAGVDRALDAHAIHCHLVYLWSPGSRTVAHGVRKLEPGYAMVVREGRVVRRWRFYDLPYGDNEAARRWGPSGSESGGGGRGVGRGDPARLAEATEAVRDGVREAVRRQLVADVPVGAFLSGGLDSSAIVACARQESAQDRFDCFTIATKDEAMAREGFATDLPYAERVAQHLDVDLHTLWAGPEIMEEIETMVYHLDEPQADVAPISVYFICKLAREKGIKVLLSGAGGDDIFSGYRRHYALMQEGYWSWLPRSARAALRGLSSWAATWVLGGGSALGRRLEKAFRYAPHDADRRLAGYFQWLDPAVLEGVYGPAMREGLAGFDAFDPLLESLGRLPKGGRDLHPLDRMLYLEGKHFLADHNLNYTDKMSMATGVEVRVPLLDPDLVALAASLPPDWKQRGREGKWIFKRACEGMLPREVIYRPKTGFGPSVRYWLTHQLRDMSRDILLSESLAGRGLFQREALERMLADNEAGRGDYAYTILAILCLEIWCRRFLDTPANSLYRI